MNGRCIQPRINPNLRVGRGLSDNLPPRCAFQKGQTSTLNRAIQALENANNTRANSTYEYELSEAMRLIRHALKG